MALPEPSLLNRHLRILSYNGGHVPSDGHSNPDRWVQNCMDPSDSVHISLRSDCDLVLHCPLPEEDCFVMTHLIVRTPVHANAPLKAGLVWVSDEEPNINAYTNKFTSIPGGRRTVEYSERAHSAKPVLGFCVPKSSDPNSPSEFVYAFNQWPCSRYIHIKFLEAHRTGPKGQIELQHLGIVGFLGMGNSKMRPLRPLSPPLVLPFQKPEDELVCLPLKAGLIPETNPFCLLVTDASFDDDAETLSMASKVAAMPKFAEISLKFLKWNKRSLANLPADIQCLERLEFEMKMSIAAPSIAIVDLQAREFYVREVKRKITTDALVEFCQGWIERTLTPFKGSAPLPPGNCDPHFPRTGVVVADSCKEITMNPNQNVLLYIHSSDSEYTYEDFRNHEQEHADGNGPVGAPPGHASVMHSIHKIASMLSDERDLLVAHMTTHSNCIDAEFHTEHGVLVWYPKDKSRMMSIPIKSPTKSMRTCDILGHIIVTFGAYEHLKPVYGDLKLKQDKMHLLRRIPIDDDDDDEEGEGEEEEDHNKSMHSISKVAFVDEVAEWLDITTNLPPIEHIPNNHRSFQFILFLEKEIRRSSSEIRFGSWNKDTNYIALGGTAGLLVPFRFGGDHRLHTASNMTLQPLSEELSEDVDINIVAWGHQALATVDSQGIARIYVMVDDRHWEIDSEISRDGAMCKSIKFSPDGEALAMAFSDGYFIIKRVIARECNSLGIVDWEGPMIRDVLHVAWSSDAKYLLLSLGHVVEVYCIPSRSFGKPIMLRCGDIIRITPGSDRVVGVAWHSQPRGEDLENLPNLALVFEKGIVQMMRTPEDIEPILFSSHMKVGTCEWNPTGTLLAVGGTDLETQKQVVKLFSLTGTLRGTTELPSSDPLTSLSWEDSGDRLMVTGHSLASIIHLTGKIRRVPPAIYEASMEPLQVVPSCTHASPFGKTQKREKCDEDNQLITQTSQTGQDFERLLTFDVADSVLTEDQMARYFAAMDEDGNGWVSKAKFKVLYRELMKVDIEGDEAYVDRLMDSYCMLGDDRLSFDEVAILLLKVTHL